MSLRLLFVLAAILSFPGIVRAQIVPSVTIRIAGWNLEG